MSPTRKQMNDAMHEEFQNWVRGLDRRQLLQAMEFSFYMDNSGGGGGIGGSISTSGSHECDLLLEMIKLQPPPPTPIHPRAVAHKVASSKGKTDGRNEAARVLRCRTEFPRLFQLFVVNTNVAGGVNNLPPALRSLLSSTGNNNGRRKRGTPAAVKFEVTARKFITAWGEALNIGCTDEQRQADDKLLTYTLLDPSKSYVTFTATKSDSTANDIRRLLHVVSRGYFLSEPYDNNNNNTPSDESSSKNKPKFCAPWLDPTCRWFSLPMYLASRFEVALWEYFQNSYHRSNQFQRQPPMIQHPWDTLPNLQLSEDMLNRAIQNALRDVLMHEILRQDKETIPLRLGDGILMDLIEANEFWRIRQILFNAAPAAIATSGDRTPDTTSGGKQFLQSISLTPIVELGTTTDRIRGLVRCYLHSEISRQMEQNLMASVDSASPATASAGSRLTPSRRAARNKKKQQRRSKVRKKQQQQQAAAQAQQKKGSSQDDDDEEEDLKGGGSAADLTTSRHDDSNNSMNNMRLSFPENGTPFVERNRNIVLCLSTLNDIVNDVFRQVGLEVSSDEESDGSTTNNNKSSSNQNNKNKKERGFQKLKADGKAKDPKPIAVKPPLPPRPTFKKPAPAAPSTPPTKPSPPAPPATPPREAVVDSSEEMKSCGVSSSNNEEIHARFSPQDNESDPTTTSSVATPTGLVDTFPTQHFPPGFFLRNDSNPWGFFHHGGGGSTSDGWIGRGNRFPQRERSILAEFFLEQERADASRQERITTSSTAASLASSTDKNNEDTMSISDKFFISLDNGSEAPASDIASTIMDIEEFPSLDIYQEEKSASESKEEDIVGPAAPTIESAELLMGDNEPELAVDHHNVVDDEDVKEDQSSDNREVGSISPEAPATPSPRLSPILLSLDDLRDIREGAKSVGNGKELVENLPSGAALTVPSSLPSSPVEQSKRRLVSSLSREDLRIKSFRDDQEFVQKKRRSATQSTGGGSPSYRNVAAGSAKGPAVRSMSSGAFPKPTKDSKSAFFRQNTPETCARSENAAELHEESQNSGGGVPSSYRNVAVKSLSGNTWKPARMSSDSRAASLSKQQSQGDLCARSETAMEGHEEYQNLNDSRRSNEENHDNITVGKDGSTTITSAMSHRESEETSNLREERNTFRDMCLTLGAEVAKLKNQLASQHGGAVYPPYDYSQGYVQPVGAGSFDPECMPPFFQKGQALGAMSDAGIHRGEYEQSQVSEDDEQFAKVNYNENGRRLSSGATVAGSDHSIEPTSSNHALQGPVGLLPAPTSRDSHEAVAVNGLQTRLTEDILKFMAATGAQHRKLDSTRDAAVERMTRLVNTLWPRAQVKVYGSHVTGLCLPSSDLDFVICLPAVHKNAPAVAPGVLEGRNAINETSQKLLARKLKGESWIDPRSMKLIERTVVPVIKVATKDTRARTVHLDISFDSPEHHGLEAVVMVKQIMEELPMIRPLVLILKQFLLDRGLLTAYTGGLSSYCLFLMVARYLQEQPSYWGDCGSLLMGFLDFYGNCFDPRSTGISVGRRQYFTRPNYVAAQRQAAGQHMWAGVSPSPAVLPSPASTGGNADFYRRNSVTEKGSIDGVRGSAGSPLLRPPRFQPAGPAGTRFMRHMPKPAVHAPLESPMDHAMPFTFDPLFVDDPLSYGNNVGRNAFRIFQVQRAFSDAHRALVASLEWDIQSTNELHDNNDYPLLKCLLQSEDVLYEL